MHIQGKQLVFKIYVQNHILSDHNPQIHAHTHTHFPATI